MNEKKKIEYTYREYRTLYIITTSLIIGYMLYLLAIFSLSVLDVHYVLQLMEGKNIKVELIQQIEDALEALGNFSIFYFIITGLFFFFWLDGASKNTLSFKPKETKFTPGWQIAYYFIPVLCLYVPYQGMKEIWRASKNPSNWQSDDNPVSSIVKWWWFFWLAFCFASLILDKQPEKAGELPNYMFIYGTLVLGFFSAFFLLIIIINIQKIQAEQHEILEHKSRDVADKNLPSELDG